MPRLIPKRQIIQQVLRCTLRQAAQTPLPQPPKTSAISARSFRYFPLAAFLAFSLAACAQNSSAWTVTPSVSVISQRADDPRIADTEEAVRFWNRTLETLGSGFRLGPVTRVVQPVSQSALHEFSGLVVTGRARPDNTPGELLQLPGNISLVLGDTVFISAAGPFVGLHKRLVVIRTATVPPLSLPNVTKNLIAHELGHALGLGHNSDHTALMCGRPADCRPAIYQSEEPRFFPLLPAETEALLGLYPATWKSSAK